MMGGAGDDILMSLSANGGPLTSDTPDFLSQKSLAPKTTTNLVTNPVLSNLSLPANLELNQDGDDEHIGPDVSVYRPLKDASGRLFPVMRDSKEKDDRFSINRVNAGDNSRNSIKPVEPYSFSPEKSGVESESNRFLTRPHATPLASSARTKRSSIYHPKRPSAIPIRSGSHASRAVQFDGDDRTSVKSISSSLTASFSKSFLFGFYNNYKNGGKASKSILSKEYWMKDESAKDCFSCTKSFTTFRRKHHCRICGQIFCGSCTFLIDGGKFQHEGKMRVCRNCHAHLDALDDSSDESSMEEQEDTINEESVESITKHYQPNTDVLLLKDDEVQSILTDSKGAKIFRSTPPPPPKMAIPATRQGGSLEITVPSRRSPSLYGGNTRTWRSMRDIYTIRDVDILPPYNQEDNGVRGGYNYQHIHGNTSHIPNLKNSFSSFMEKGNGGDQHKSRSHSPNSVIANLSNSDFKFEFNYGRKNFQDYLNKTPIGSQNSKYRPISRSESSPTLPLHAVDSHADAESKYSDDCSEDERSMSLYAALNDSHQDQHYMRPTRNTTKSLQRAQASLQRMRSRGRAKNRPHTNVVRKQFEFLNNSSPYLKAPPVHENEDNTSCRDSNLCSERPSNRIEHTSSSRDMRRIISTASVLRLKSQENKTELSDVAQLHMHALLKQVLDDQDIDSLKEWIATFKPILCSLQCIRLDARNMTGLDFKQHYVKIKRIDGGSIGDSKFISGVVYSKNVPLKSMMRPLKNPRILLIMFPLEYQKSENHFMSLDSILAQEQEYLRKLVLRLKSQAPDLLLVGANVSGYALKLLDDAGIIVQFNMKPQVIERIAKLTEASIAITVDKLATNIKLGTCNLFEVRSFCYGNIVKSYSFLEGCKESLGGTVLLRGSSSEVLRKIKDITEFMVYSVFSLKSESSFFSDNFLQLSVDYYETVRSREKEPHAKGYFAAFVEKFNQRILSVSPTVQFPIPFLLQKARNLEAELSQKELEGKSLLTEPDTSKKNINKTIHDLGLESALTSQDLRNLIKFVHSKEVEDLSARFKWRSRQWELSYALSKNMLGTGTHQTINLLYTMISKKTATPCIGPQLVSIDFFWDTDISIGQFIENIVATASCPCSHGCGSLLIDHYRSYVHGTGKVDVLIEQFQSRLPSLKNVLLTWSYCKECSSSTPILQMSEKTWNYSFGKYLELLFWSRNEGIKTIGNCHHDFAKDHVKYFSYNDLMVRMEYSQVEVHELITPRSQITWKPNIDIKLKVELYYQILEKINNLYASISDRLMRIKLDSMSTERAIAGESRIIQLKKRVVVEKDHLIESTESIYRSTPGDQHLPLNVIIRFLHDHAAEWDNEFADFEKTFLPSEMDIARITAIQLKKLFTDAMKTDQDQGTLAANDDNGCVEDEDQSKLASSITKDVIQSSSTDILPKEANNYRIAQESDDSPNLGEHASLSAKQRVWETAPRPSLVHYQTVPNIKKHPQTDEASLPKDDTFLKDHRKGTINANSALLGDDGSGRLPSLELSRKKTNSSDCPRSFSACSNGSNGTMRAKEQSNSGKVGQLANFFDRIHFDALSKEFELQREFESLQLNKNRYKALRVEPSKPIVEIYKNVKDAIDGPLHTDSRKTKLPFTGMRSYAVGSGSVGEQKSSSNELETKLGRSIHQWGEQILRKEKGIQTENEVDSQNDTQAHDNNEALMPILTPAAAKMHKINPDSQPERSSLMKTLANFWADRSATLWKPLDYPTVPTEHIFVDSPVIIREDEPCSLIAFCLSSTDYLQKMRSSTSFDNRETNNTKVGPAQKKPDVPVKGSDQEVCDESQTELNLPQEKCMAEAGHPTLQLPTASENADDCSEKKSMTNKTGAPKSSLEKIMTKKTAMHLRYQFQDGNSVMSCKIFFAEQFDAFRKTCGCGDNFIQSLSRCVKWDSSGGKSGSAFLKTLDDRFVIKELSHTELDSFIKFAPSYFEYMAQAMFHDLPTALAKVFGFYQIQTKNSESGKSFKMDVIIMENLFYSKKTSRIFDLKGSMRNRHVKQTGKENEVLLDENMVEYIYESPIFVREYDKKLLRASLWNDTLFLAKMNVMDYSLVVGVDNNDHTLTVGIIDFIRTFTWDKKLESWVKERGFVGGSTKEPTVVTPRQYKNRFREAMERYILMVPDPWFQENYD